MIRNVWTVLCRDIITDRESNAVSYLRCIEEGSASGLPARIGPVYLGTLWEKVDQAPVSIRFRVVTVSPGRKKLVVLQTKPIILAERRHRLNFRLNFLVFEEFGIYSLALEFNRGDQWEAAAEISVLINQVQEQRAVAGV